MPKCNNLLYKERLRAEEVALDGNERKQIGVLKQVVLRSSFRCDHNQSPECREGRVLFER